MREEEEEEEAIHYFFFVALSTLCAYGLRFVTKRREEDDITVVAVPPDRVTLHCDGGGGATPHSSPQARLAQRLEPDDARPLLRGNGNGGEW